MDHHDEDIYAVEYIDGTGHSDDDDDDMLAEAASVVAVGASLFLAMLMEHEGLFIEPASYKNHYLTDRIFSKIYAFGDSSTDTGNCIELLPYLTPPYGMTTFGKPSGRWSDGYLVLDFLAKELSLPYVPPYLNKSSDFSHGVNFAYAGSTAIDYEFYVEHNATKALPSQITNSLQTQLGWFNEFIDRVECAGKCPAQCKAIMEGTLFWVGTMGGNDYRRINGTSISPITLREIAVANVIHLVQDLLDKGAKYIVIQGPEAQGYELDVAAHNALLQQQLDQVREQNPDASILFADFIRALTDNVMNAKKKGFNDPGLICCGNETILCGRPGAPVCADPSKYMAWDGVHATAALNALLANQFFHQDFTRPPFDSLQLKCQDVIEETTFLNPHMDGDEIDASDEDASDAPLVCDDEVGIDVESECQ
ncbi:GDSL esterase/lipase At3g48460-like [Tasmannia lanceolata]|uniref:GDSL esterase/lipase At3g48460-like n=1 Tax=Tasmannia lanceolata TaxID=3420 RepID=UPI004064B681